MAGIVEAPESSFATWVRRATTIISARFQTARRERRMEIVERLELGGRRQLMLVICDGKRYLVGIGPDSVHAITEIRSGADEGPDAEQAG